jgi:hypothetical protein
MNADSDAGALWLPIDERMSRMHGLAANMHGRVTQLMNGLVGCMGVVVANERMSCMHGRCGCQLMNG